MEALKKLKADRLQRDGRLSSSQAQEVMSALQQTLQGLKKAEAPQVSSAGRAAATGRRRETPLTL